MVASWSGEQGARLWLGADYLPNAMLRLLVM